MDTHQFRGIFVRSIKSKHKLALSLGDGTKNIKLNEGILRGAEAITHKLMMREIV